MSDCYKPDRIIPGIWPKPKPECSLAQLILNESQTMPVFCRAHPLAPIRPYLAEDGIVTATQLRSLPRGRRVKVTGYKLMVHTPPIKSGKRVMFITMEDETGLMDVVVFERTQRQAARAILTSDILTFMGKLEKRGHQGRSISVVANCIIPAWTGKLEDILRCSQSS